MANETFNENLKKIPEGETNIRVMSIDEIRGMVKNSREGKKGRR